MDLTSISEDIAELKSFEEQATRPFVQSLLKEGIQRLERQREVADNCSTSSDQGTEAPISAQKEAGVHGSSILPTNKIQTYAWDQSEKFVKLYVTLPTVHEASQDQISTSYKLRAVSLFVKNLKGQNHQMEINNLLYEILPDESYYKVKTDMVLLMLKKKESKNWAYVTLQEQRLKDKKNPTPKFDEKEDPQVGLMKMMKQMYEEGDDEMKRTIKKAWVESQEKKSKGEMGEFDSL